MSRALAFTSLTVREAPGLPDAFTIDALSPGVVLIHGPNGVGKSTTARVMQRLLWTDARQHLTYRADATLTVDGVLHTAQRNRDDLVLRRNGTPVSSLELPPWSDHDRYLLSLHDLIVPDGGTDDFARRVASLSQGGFRFDEAAATLEVREKPRTGAGIFRETERYRQARKDRRAAEDVQQKASAARSELDRATSQLEAAETAQRQLDALHRAIARATAAKLLDEARAELATFPDGMDRLQEDAVEALARLQRERRATLLEITDVEATASAAAEAAVAAFTGGPPTADSRERLRLLVSEWQQAARDSAGAAGELERANAAMRARRDAIGNAVDELTLVRVMGDALPPLEQFTVDETSWQTALDAARQEVARLTQELDAFEAAVRSTDDPAILRSGMLLLARWLREGADAAASNNARGPGSWYDTPPYTLLRGILALLAVVAAVASVVLGIQQHPAWYAATLIVLVSAVFGFVRTGAAGAIPAAPDPRPARRAEFEALRMNVAPPEWTEAAVATTVEQLAQAIADAYSASQLQSRTRERLAEQLRMATRRLDELEARADEFTRRRTAILGALGITRDWSLARGWLRTRPSRKSH
jgi:ABC-type iron transport system FetAB ATPase subunit